MSSWWFFPVSRGTCPSCAARRMAETAAHLADYVIPNVLVRQWVLSFQFAQHTLFAVYLELLASVWEMIRALVRLGQSEDVLRNVTKYQLWADWSDTPDQRFAQVSLYVILLCIAVTTVRHDRLLAGVETGFA